MANHSVKDVFRADVLRTIDSSSCPKAEKVKSWCRVVLVARSPNNVHCLEFNDPCVQFNNFVVEVDKIWWARASQLLLNGTNFGGN